MPFAAPGPRAGLATAQMRTAAHFWEAAAELLAEGGPAPPAHQVRADLAAHEAARFRAQAA
eukprot:8897736-Pyramimonas_sp.AAC.1